MSNRLSMQHSLIIQHSGERSRVVHKLRESFSTTDKENNANPPFKFAPNGRKYWSQEEDNKLLRLVQEQGAHKWRNIAVNFVNRSAKQCRDRWRNQLNPNISHKPWTLEEDERLNKLHKIHGNKWSVLARNLEGRTDNSIKNHWHALHRVKRRLSFPRKTKPRTARTSPSSNKISSSNVPVKDSMCTAAQTMKVPSISPVDRQQKKAKHAKASASFIEPTRQLLVERALEGSSNFKDIMNESTCSHEQEAMTVTCDEEMLPVSWEKTGLDVVLSWSDDVLDDIFHDVFKFNASIAGTGASTI